MSRHAPSTGTPLRTNPVPSQRQASHSQIHKPAAFPPASPWQHARPAAASATASTAPSASPHLPGTTAPGLGGSGQAPLNLPSLPRLGSQNSSAAATTGSNGSAPIGSHPHGPVGPGPIGPSTPDGVASTSQPIPGYGNLRQGPTFAQVAQQGVQRPTSAASNKNGAPSGLGAISGPAPGLGGGPGFPGAPMGASLPRLGSHTADAHGSSDNNASSSTNGVASLSDMDKYGLKPLLRMMDGTSTHNGPSLGNDLMQLGLNLSGDEPLARTFSSPWVAETPKHAVIPDFRLPECYNIPSVVPQQQKLQGLNEETLFYIFYTMPRDAMQEAAAVELTNRNWRYHKELKLWLTKDPLSEPIQTGTQAESGIYVFFDPNSWEKVKKEYVLYYPDIA